MTSVRASTDKSRHTPGSEDEIFRNLDRPSERNFVRRLTCMPARDLSIYLLTTGVIPRRRTAIKPRRAEFTVTGSNSFSFSLSLLPSPLPVHRSLAFLLARGSYVALWSESWDRGLAGSHDRWGFGLTPLV